MRTILVGRVKGIKTTFSCVVPLKGSSGEFAVRRILAFIKEVGMEAASVVFRSDQEPAIIDLINEVARRRQATTFVEQSPVGSSASNGVAERAVQSVEGQLRTISDALQHRLHIDIPSDHAVIAWMVEYSSVLLNKYEVGRNGKTAYERLRGRKSKMLGVEFGELVHFRRTPLGDRKDKLDSL